MISPSSPLTLQSGGSSTLAASVVNAEGRAVSGATVGWSSSDPSVASATGGVVTAIKVGTANITASAGSVSSAPVAVTVTPGSASALAVRTEPVGGAVGSALATQPVVEVHDAAGNLVTTSTAPVTVAIGSGGGTLGGSATLSATGGVAAFSGLTISGSAGDRTLVFTSSGLASTTSSTFTMTPPPTPVIVLDSSSITFSTTTSTNPAPASIRITDGGTVAFTTVTVEAPVYDVGQPTGWLSASLAGTAAPFTLTFTVTSTSLAVGSYHGTVKVDAAGATNTPQTVSITLNVLPSSTLTYGSATEKIRILDPGGSYAPTVTATVGGQPAPGSSLSFVSRAPTVATGDASGKVTAVGAGEAWVAGAVQNGAQDSVFVIVTRSATTPVLRSDQTTYSMRAGDSMTVTFTLDPRTAQVGAATVIVGYETDNGVFTLTNIGVPTETPQPVVASSSFGVFKITVAAANGIVSQLPVMRLSFVTPVAGRSGYLTFGVLDMTALDGTDITTQVTATRFPVIVR